MLGVEKHMICSHTVVPRCWCSTSLIQKRHRSVTILCIRATSFFSLCHNFIKVSKLHQNQPPGVMTIPRTCHRQVVATTHTITGYKWLCQASVSTRLEDGPVHHKSDCHMSARHQPLMLLHHAVLGRRDPLTSMNDSWNPQ